MKSAENQCAVIDWCNMYPWEKSLGVLNRLIKIITVAVQGKGVVVQISVVAAQILSTGIEQNLDRLLEVVFSDERNRRMNGQGRLRFFSIGPCGRTFFLPVYCAIPLG